MQQKAIAIRQFVPMQQNRTQSVRMKVMHAKKDGAVFGVMGVS